jgi:XTP/dITP diphosphohydrolase
MNQTPDDSAAATPSLVLGTGNRKKGIELAELLAPLGIRVDTLADFADALTIDESGGTFAENATLKATRQAAHLKRWVLGDDSGLEVDALDGRPGIYSARFAGPGATDADNNRRLLEELGDLEPERRGAQFVCHLVLADPTGSVRAESVGRCRGRIRHEPSGSGGFGYDPLFEIIEYHRTFGDLSAATKACLSHRARAVQSLIPQLVELLPFLRSSSLTPNL